MTCYIYNVDKGHKIYKMPATFPKDTLVGIRTTLLDVIVHLDQAAINPAEKKGRRKMSPRQTLAAVQYKRKSCKMAIWTDTRKSRLSMLMSWIQNGEKTSTLVHNYADHLQKTLDKLADFQEM